MAEVLRELYLSQPSQRKRWQAFLTARGIDNFSAAEIDQIERTLGLFNEHDELIGTGSISGKIIKYVGVCDEGELQKGARFNQLVTALQNQMAQLGRFQLFVFTKPEYQISFEHVGFKTLAVSTIGAIMEKGTPNISEYLAAIPKAPAEAQFIASIVMNANPFTKGHRYLVEQAAKANDFVYVFVVNEDTSLFTTAERTTLVEAGCVDLKNVVVANGGDYMVSFLSFPSYFIKNPDQIIAYQTALDADLFKQQIAPTLGINRRYIGSEPLSHTTAIYNQSLQRILPPTVAVVEVPRLVDQNQEIVSARTVRQAIAAGNRADWRAMVPTTTAKFIEEHLTVLQERIQKGQQINGN